MSETIENSKGAASFGAMTRKQRTLLTKEERRYIALGRAVRDLEFARDNAARAAESATTRYAEAKDKLAAAVAAFEAAIPVTEVQ